MDIGQLRNVYLSCEEAHVLPVDVLPEGHLQELEPHVHGLDDVVLLGHGVLAAGALPPGHLGLDGLESLEHLRLQTLERGVEAGRAYLVEPTGHLQGQGTR